MVQIIDAPPSFGSQMGRGLGNTLGSLLKGGVEGYVGKKQREGENKSYKEKFDIDLEGINDPAIRSSIVTELLKGPAPGEKKQLAAAQQGLETVKRQKERLASGHLGPKLNFNPWASGGESKLISSLTGEGKAIRSGYEQAGKELIQLASTLPIRNQKEFDTLGKKLYDPSLHQEEIAGILQEMEDHIQDAIDTLSPRKSKKSQKNQKITGDIVDSLLDETNNDVTKAKKLAADRGYTW